METEKKRLTRSASDKVFAGVLSGIAEHYNLSTTWLRIGVLFATFFTTGITVIIYLAAMIVVPKPRDN